MSYKNNMKIQFINKSANEGFARVATAAFVTQLDVTVEQLADIKTAVIALRHIFIHHGIGGGLETAVSEAVTNSIVHGYEGMVGYITLECELDGSIVTIVVSDCGRGITDVALARQPLYTSRPELERSGMGFTVMETFMDTVEVTSAPGLGTTVKMTKNLQG